MRNHDDHREDGHLCAEIQSTLPLFVGGDLEAQALAEVRLHLFECPRCAERALSARAARRELVGALRLAARPGPDLWAGVRSALVEEGVIEPIAPRITPRISAAKTARPWWLSGLGLAAAAAAVVVGIGVGLRWNSGHEALPVGGPQPIAFDPNVDGSSMPVVLVGDPANTAGALRDDSALSDLAALDGGQTPIVEQGGLRRLKPGERSLRDTVPSLPIDRAFLYGTPSRNSDAMQPVGLHRVGANAPRW